MFMIHRRQYINVQGYSRKGAALQFLNRFEEAMNAYMEAKEHDPNNQSLQKSIDECQEKLTGTSDTLCSYLRSGCV